MKIVATAVMSQDLQPGELFSSGGPDYWNHQDPWSLGERVYIRTTAPTPPDQVDLLIYRITIVQEE